MDIRLRNIILCLVNKHFPSSNTGRKRVKPEYVLDELLRVLWTGCPWRSLRTTESSYQTIHRHFMIWTQKNVFREAYSIAYKLQSRPTRRNLRFQCIDASFNGVSQKSTPLKNMEIVNGNVLSKVCKDDLDGSRRPERT